MVDHIYISDQRGFRYYDLFQLVIDTTNIKNSNSILQKQVLNTRFISLDKGNQDKTNSIIDMMVYHSNPFRILLYSENTSTCCYLFVQYMMDKYHFTKEDLSRLFSTSTLPTVMLQQMNDAL